MCVKAFLISLCILYLYLSDHIWPDATVQLVCGRNPPGYGVVNVTADANGAFGIYTVKIPNIHSVLHAALHNQCRVDVITPLSACDESLANNTTGTLTAPVRIVGNPALAGFIGLGGEMLYFDAMRFSFDPSSLDVN